MFLGNLQGILTIFLSQLFVQKNLFHSFFERFDIASLHKFTIKAIHTNFPHRSSIHGYKGQTGCRRLNQNNSLSLSLRARSKHCTHAINFCEFRHHNFTEEFYLLTNAQLLSKFFQSRHIDAITHNHQFSIRNLIRQKQSKSLHHHINTFFRIHPSDVHNFIFIVIKLIFFQNLRTSFCRLKL